MLVCFLAFCHFGLLPFRGIHNQLFGTRALSFFRTGCLEGSDLNTNCHLDPHSSRIQNQLHRIGVHEQLPCASLTLYIYIVIIVIIGICIINILILFSFAILLNFLQKFKDTVEGGAANLT